MLGRFGRKATTVSLLHQATLAFHDDIGLTTESMPVDLYNPQVGGPSGESSPGRLGASEPQRLGVRWTKFI